MVCVCGGGVCVWSVVTVVVQTLCVERDAFGYVFVNAQPRPSLLHHLEENERAEMTHRGICVVVFVMMVLLSGGVKAIGCPSACGCHDETIDCSNQGLTSIPSDINTWNPTTVMYMYVWLCVGCVAMYVRLSDTRNVLGRQIPERQCHH